MFSQTDLQTTFIQSANLRVENNFSKDDMATIFILFGSIIIGFLLRKINIPGVPSMTVNVIIWILLLLMGISIGSNPEIISNIGNYGKQAVVIGVLATVGSAAAAILISKNSDPK